MKAFLPILLLAGLAGCANVPDTDIKQPLSVRPAQPLELPDNGGAIFQAPQGQGRPGLALLEDRRARYVGDILTVNLVEKTSASRKSETTDERKSNASYDIPSPTVLGYRDIVGATSWETQNNNKAENKDNETNSNTVSGSITVSVVEVLGNGNLVVAGEKRVRVNQDTEYIRLAGVVSPAHISAANSVSSTQLADVQIESTSSQRFDSSQFVSMFSRFFVTVLPF